MVDSLFFNSVSPARQEARIARDPVRPVAAAGSSPALGGQQEHEAPKVDEALQNLTEHLRSSQRTLQFSVDEASGGTVVRVIDSETSEVIRQIPSEEVLVIASRLEAATKGLLLSEQV